MTTKEFSDAFDTLLASYNHKADFGDLASYADVTLDEYEKSIFLTLAQDNIVKNYFDRQVNSLGAGFDDSIRRQVDFSSLIEVATLTETENSTSNFDDRGVIFKLPLCKDSEGNDVEGTCKVLFMLNEKIECQTLLTPPSTFGPKKTYVVVPINFKEYDREMSRPFSQPLKKQAWRLYQNGSTGYDIDSELIVKQLIADNYKTSPSNEGDIKMTYKIRYVRRPAPIVLELLPDGLTIDGISEESNCELNPILHMEILEEAVKLALNSKGIETRELKAAREAARNNRT